MSKLIALKSGSHEILDDAWNSDFSYLKQQALLFDQIGIFKLSNFYKTLEKTIGLYKELSPDLSEKLEKIIMELQWLQQIGIVFELTIQEEINNNLADFGNENDVAKKLLSRALEITTTDLRNTKDDAHKIELLREQHFTILRLMAIIMETKKGVSAVTTLPYTKYNYDFPNSSKSNVAQIVISKLPIPSNETPWEKLIDYRNDEGNQKNLISLPRWVRKITTESLSSAEIEEELEWLINEFHSHMDFHKMKTNTETLEVMVKVLPETIENLIKLKFSKLPEPFFAFKKRQISLLEAELNAPGREMAYIIKARDEF